MMWWSDLPPKPAIIQPAPQGYERQRGLFVPKLKPLLALTPFVIAKAGIPSPPIITPTASASEGNNLTTYSFASLAIGTAAEDRLVLAVCFGHESADVSASGVSSVTIGGIAATIHTQFIGVAPNEITIAFATAIVPTGTTATVSITFNSGQVRAGVSVYTIFNYTAPAPVFTVQNSAEGTNASIGMRVNMSQKGVCGSTSRSGSSNTCTWTNATEDVDVQIELAEGNLSTSSVAANSGDISVTATWDDSASMAVIGAVWQGKL